MHINAVELLLRCDDILASDCRLQLGKRVCTVKSVEYRNAFLVGRVVHACLEEKAVKLRLGKGVNSCILDRVLSRNDDKRLCKAVCHSVDGRLPLLHALEQTRLRFRGGAVDLIGKNYVREHRSRRKLKLGFLHIIIVDSGEIGGEQVGCELNTLSGAVKTCCE